MPPPRKPLMRNLGEFFGYIVKGVKTPVEEPPGEREELRRETEETDRDGVTLRRTTIEEIEYKSPAEAKKRPRD